MLRPSLCAPAQSVSRMHPPNSSDRALSVLVGCSKPSLHYSTVQLYRSHRRRRHSEFIVCGMALVPTATFQPSLQPCTHPSWPVTLTQ